MLSYQATLPFLLLIMLISSKNAIGQLWGNIGSVYLQSALNSVSDPTRELLLKKAKQYYINSLSQSDDNPTSIRGMGFIHWNAGDDREAFNEWQQLGLNEEDYIYYGRLSHSESESLRWYKLAEQVASMSTKLWLDVGLICQIRPYSSDICDRFFEFNNHNWFVDSGFEFDRSAWRFNRREGASYEIVECPDLPLQKCATVKVLSETSQQSVSWHQCLQLEPNQTYYYSAWLKVEGSDVGRWRPLYFQGRLNGEHSGSWLGDEMTATPWQYWERTFIAPDFDDQRVCFYPIILFGSGQAWFYNATLSIQVDN